MRLHTYPVHDVLCINESPVAAAATARANLAIARSAHDTSWHACMAGHACMAKCSDGRGNVCAAPTLCTFSCHVKHPKVCYLQLRLLNAHALPLADSCSVQAAHDRQQLLHARPRIPELMACTRPRAAAECLLWQLHAVQRRASTAGQMAAPAAL